MFTEPRAKAEVLNSQLSSVFNTDKASGPNGIPPLVFKRDSLPSKFQRFLLISIKTVSISELCPANENKQRICHSQERKEIGFIKL